MSNMKKLTDKLLCIKAALMALHGEIVWIESYGSKYHTLEEMRAHQERFKAEEKIVVALIEKEAIALEEVAAAARKAHFARKEKTLAKRNATIAKNKLAAEQEFIRLWSGIKARA